jgi:hypothetical protein
MAARRSADKKAGPVVVKLTGRPRNPLTTLARKRAAGPHGPSRKAERAAAKVRLKKLPETS